LLAAGIVNRILGFIPRIALPRVMGAEGVGLYQMGYPFLIVILTLTTGGIPLAVAKLVAEAESEGNEGRVQAILRMSLAFTLTLSALFTLVCFLAAPWISSHLLTDSRVYYTFLCMLPVIPIVGISSVYRGYFQGRHNMVPTAASQVVETVVRIVTMLILSFTMLPYGMEYAAAGAMLGIVIGEAAGMLVLLIQYWGSRDKYRRFAAAKVGSMKKAPGYRSAISRIVRLSVPVTLSRLVGSCSYFLESVLIVRSLAAAGIATAVATTQYGYLQGMIIPVLLLPGVLTYSLSVSLVPSLSEAAAKKDMRTVHKRLHQSLRLSLVSGAPFAVIMFVLAEPLCSYLYDTGEIGMMLKMMAPIALFIYFQSPLQATLQALNRPGNALVNTLIGSVVKLTLIYVLASKPEYGILGAVMAINLNIVIVTLLHWVSVSRSLKFTMQTADFLKTGMAMLLMALTCWLVITGSWTNDGLVRFIGSLLAGAIVYLICIIRFKLVDRHDFHKLPWIGKQVTAMVNGAVEYVPDLARSTFLKLILQPETRFPHGGQVVILHPTIHDKRHRQPFQAHSRYTPFSGWPAHFPILLDHRELSGRLQNREFHVRHVHDPVLA
jgi:stage V sporulation protein B